MTTGPVTSSAGQDRTAGPRPRDVVDVRELGPAAGTMPQVNVYLGVGLGVIVLGCAIALITRHYRR